MFLRDLGTLPHSGFVQLGGMIDKESFVFEFGPFTLDDKGISRCVDVKALSGMPTGESGRETDWPIVEKLLASGKADHWMQCKSILSGK